MGSGHWTDKDRFLAVFKINSVIFVIELLAGWYSGSLSMISDGFHVSLHVIVSLVALASEYQFLGFSPIKIKRWSAWINIILFFPLAYIIASEANVRWQNPPTVHLTPIFFTVAILGFAANICAVFILDPKHHRHSVKNENVLIFYIHMIVDTVGSIIVLIGAIEIARTGNYSIDPIASLFLSGLIVLSAIIMSWKLFHGNNH